MTLGLFSSKKHPVERRPFWQVPPFPSTDPEVLYQHGISCLTSGDGRGMLQVGFALWDLVGLNQHQAWDFISDGFTSWSDAGAPDSEKLALLQDILERLDKVPMLPVDVDLYSLQPGVVEPTVPYHTARAWAISEALIINERNGTRTPDLDAVMLARLDAMHQGLMPARTLSQYDALKRSAGRSS